MPEKREQDAVERQTAFVERARQALLKAEAGGPVYDGPAYAAYLRERERAALEPGQTAALAKPPPQSWRAIRAQRSSQ